jgi:hypothetical protein
VSFPDVSKRERPRFIMVLRRMAHPVSILGPDGPVLTDIAQPVRVSVKIPAAIPRARPFQPGVNLGAATLVG